MFAVKPVFPYQNIHPIFWTAWTQYISLHDRSFGGGILQLRNSISMCNAPGFLPVHDTLIHNLGRWLRHTRINVTQWNVKTHSLWTALIIIFQCELCKGYVGKAPYTSWVYDHGLMSYKMATVTLRYWVLNTLKTVTHQTNINELAAMKGYCCFLASHVFGSKGYRKGYSQRPASMHILHMRERK